MVIVFIFAFYILIPVFVIVTLIDLYGTEMNSLYKLLWFIGILLLPVLGAILYFLISKKGAKDTSIAAS